MTNITTITKSKIYIIINDINNNNNDRSLCSKEKLIDELSRPIYDLNADYLEMVLQVIIITTNKIK